MKTSAYLLILLAGIAAWAAPARDISFEHIGVDRGLSNSTVNAIAQDAAGYLWVATPDGLNRYDGDRIKVYRGFADTDSSVTRNDIRAAATAPDGSLWAATGGAIWHYDALHDDFDRFSGPQGAIIRYILPGEHDFYVATGSGIYSFNPGDGTFTFCKGAPREVVYSLCRFKGSIYAGTAAGIYRHTGADDGWKKLPVLEHSEINTLLGHGDNLLIGTDDSGLYFYRPASGSLRNYHAGDGSGLGSDYVRSLAADADGNIWTGTFDGLYIYNPITGRFSAHTPSTDDPSSLSHSSVRAIFADNQGGVWLGTFYGGLNYYNPFNNRFGSLSRRNGSRSLNDNVVSVIAEDPYGRLWIGTNNGGVDIYTRADGSYRYITKADGLGSNDVKAIHFDTSAGKAYIGTHIGGLSVADLRTGRILSHGSAFKNVYSILPAAEPGKYWLGCLDYIALYDAASGRISVQPVTSARGRQLDNISVLFRDPQGRIWVGSESGLGVFNESDGRLVPAQVLPAEFPTNVRVNHITASPDRNSLFISTHDGLWQLRADGDSLIHYTAERGLPGNIVLASEPDNTGILWMSTNGGLASLDPAKGEIRSFSSSYGLAGKQFMPGSVLRDEKGRIYFGGISGVTFFDPASLKKNSFSAPPVLSGLRLFNKEVRPGDSTGLLQKSLAFTDRIEFRADQSTFTIEFSAANFSNGSNSYEYMLDGMNKEWTPAAPGLNSVTYSNLPAGTYTFMLRAANSDNVAASETASVEIHIRPLWYRTWWATLILVVLGLGIAAFILYYLWHKRMLEEQIRAERLDRERQHELNEMKVRFFVNMSHELRTPLSLILLPLTELIDSGVSPKVMQKLTMIKNNTLRILHIVNQLLDYRRAELGVFQLKVRSTDVNALAANIADTYRSMADHKNITFTVDSDLAEGTQTVDPEYIDLILNNLLTNAFKYTHNGQSVNLALTEDDGKLVIRVSDTGCGVAPDKLDKIFVRFYQVSDKVGGSGIGLSLVKRLVDLHHGSITVASELGKGTTFTVVIPAGADAYSPEEIEAGRAAVAESLNMPDNAKTVQLPDDFIDEEPENQPENDAASGTDEKDGEEDCRPVIMVVDDNPEILKYVADSLSENYRVLPAANGAKAIELLANANIDLIISDVMMPDIDGVQLCRTIKRNLRTSHIPVIMLSAKAELSDQMEAMKVGADDYLAKPFSMPLLLAKIKNQLHTRARLISHYSKTTLVEPDKAPLNPLDEAFLRKAMKIMEEHMDDSDFTTDMYASKMCMSRSNLHLKMKALTGESTNEMIRRVRMNKAQELLRTGLYTIAEVSSMVGFTTPSYFATTFRKFFGESPSDFLKKLR